MRKLKRKRPKDHFLLKLCAVAFSFLLLSIWLKSRFVFLFTICLWFSIFFTAILLLIRTSVGRKGILYGLVDWIAIIVAVSLAFSLILVMGDMLGPRLWCRMNLRNLGKAISLYADEHNDLYPAYDKWCDLLIENCNISKDILRCRSTRKNGLCDYAMNPDADPSKASDIVVLFESKSGWNQYGGAELLKLDNHEIEGSNILFNDGHVEFIKVLELDNLNWGDK